jgi:hypothetical protein
MRKRVGNDSVGVGCLGIGRRCEWRLRHTVLDTCHARLLLALLVLAANVKLLLDFLHGDIDAGSLGFRISDRFVVCGKKLWLTLKWGKRYIFPATSLAFSCPPGTAAAAGVTWHCGSGCTFCSAHVCF